MSPELPEEMLRKPLEINKKFGRIEGMATQYGNLGVIAKERGNIAGARELWIKARGLFERIGMPQRVELVQGWLDELPEDGGSSAARM